jgi:hypothetical protein
VTIGFTPSHCTVRNPSSGGIAEPLLILGSMRYAFLFVLMTRLAKSQAQQAGFVTPFSDLSGDFANRRDLATRIHESNELENLTIVAYVHEFQNVSSFLAWLKAHFDGENCPHPSWDVAISAWKTFFLPKLGRYVSVVIIGNSQKSISDSLHRKKAIGLAAEELKIRFECNPEYLKYVLDLTLCMKDFNGRYCVIPVHFFEQLVDLSPAIHHILHYQDWFLQTKHLKLLKYLVDEIIVAFSFTSNRYRFHLYCQEFLTIWKRSDDPPIGPNCSFTGSFLCWLYKTYGSWSRVEMKTGYAEGAIHHQTTKTHPVLAMSLNKTLRLFSYAVDGMKAKEANLTNFKKTVNSLNAFVGGSGNLLNKKSLAIAAACGRASDAANWLKYCIPGSSHHFTRLKQPPFYLQVQIR